MQASESPVASPRDVTLTLSRPEGSIPTAVGPGEDDDDLDVEAELIKA